MGIGRKHQDFQILVVAGPIEHFAEHFRAFGIIVGRSARQGQLHLGVIGLDAADTPRSRPADP